MFLLIMIETRQRTPFVTVIMTAALVGLSSEVIRVAEIDGAGRWLLFRHIIFPMILPAFLLVAMFRLIDALMTLDIIFTTTAGGPGFTTQTLSYWIYQQGSRYFNISHAAAVSWVLLAGCMLVAAGFLLWRRHVTRWQTELGV